MKYQIKWSEIKKTGETNGRKWSITEMLLVDEEGNETDKVSTFDTVVTGGTVEGEIVKNDKGYLNFVTKKAVANGNFKTAQIEKVIERKEKSISHFQDNKEWSIKVSSTMRDAVALAIAELNASEEKNPGTLASRIENWRDWLWEKWDVNITDKPPF